MPDAARMLSGPARLDIERDGVVREANERARQMLQLLGDAAGDTILSLCPEAQPDGLRSAEGWRIRVDAACAGLMQSFAWQFRRRDGTPVDALVELEQTRVALEVRIRDLTALRSAERALRDSQARLQQIVDHTSAAVFAKSLDGRYLFGNREFARLARCPAEAIAGATDDDLFPAEIAAAFREHDAQVLDSRDAAGRRGEDPSSTAASASTSRTSSRCSPRTASRTRSAASRPTSPTASASRRRCAPPRWPCRRRKARMSSTRSSVTWRRSSTSMSRSCPSSPTRAGRRCACSR